MAKTRAKARKRSDTPIAALNQRIEIPNGQKTPIALPPVLAGLHADWLVITQAAVLVETKTKPRRSLVVVMMPLPRERHVALAIEAPSSEVRKGLDALLANHSHAVITKGASSRKIMTLIEAYIERWKATPPGKACGCKPIKTGAKLKPAAHAGDGCPRENAARARRRPRRGALPLHVN